MIKVKVLQDESSHWYIIPENLWDEWDRLEEATQDAEEDSKEWYKLIDEFCNKFDIYMTGGGINNYQLHISEEELKRLTGES